MADALPARQDPTDNSGWSVPGLTCRPLAPSARFVLRLPAESVAAAGNALGLDLPVQPCRSARAGSLAALWLGPDEWLLLDDDPAAVPPPIQGPHALVDVSHRNCGLLLDGPRAAEVLAHGCPLDLHPDVFPAGKCTRTVFGKAEIVLWRTDQHTFRIEFWRSFAEYVNSLLALAARGVAHASG